MAHAFDLTAFLRRIRRSGDLSQRDLAKALGISPAVIAHAEAGTRDLPTRVLARAAQIVGWRLVLVDAEGNQLAGMADDAVRDRGRRRFPAHLDTRYADEGWWHDAHHWSRAQAWYTFDLDRGRRDGRRSRNGIPDDHQLPRPGDAPQERQAARRRAALERKREEVDRRRAAGELRYLPELTCTCPPGCDEVDDWSGRPVHTPGCPCGCDVG